MEQATLKAKTRETKGSSAAKKMRRTGQIPGVLYGHKQEPVSVVLNREEVMRIVSHRIKMVTLQMDKLKETALIRDVQFDTFGDKVLHMDFERIAMDELVEVEVPVVFVGTAKGQGAGGVIDHPITDLTVSCLPGNIPESIRVSIAHMEIGDIIHVKDVKAPEGIKILTDPEAILVMVRQPVEEVAAAAPVAEGEEGAAPAEPELIRRERATEEEEEEEKK